MKAKIVDSESAREAVVNLLMASGLPYSDLELAKGPIVTYHDEDGQLVGSGALEWHDSLALLRSVAVTKPFQGHSIGKEIIADLLRRAQAHHTHEVYLLTETARPFFLKRGFEDVPREAVPVPIKESTEYKSVCSTSAACMVYKFR